ncbi:hypothetical protein [Thermaurantiacus sp.]
MAGGAAAWGQKVAAWGAASVAALLVSSLAHSLMVQGELARLGVDLPMGVRLSGMARDAVGLAPTLGVVLAGALLVAFAVAGLLRPRLGPLLRRLAYPLAGLAAVALALLGMRLSFGFSPLAGARTAGGFALMSSGGLVAGLVFAWIARPAEPPGIRSLGSS